ncbi:hypothetical protein ACFVXG_03925 [Kitasatospora sp. NPDC058162]|uniref:hypothetical protein n=1 Tax=Kitasatospora sp. NPDC058162 TaxID=3346362 RepID=UPI0036DAFE38
MSVEENPDIQAAVRLLIQTLERHARVMAGSNPAPPDAVTAEDAVRAAAVAYADAVMNHNGWGHPFNLEFADEATTDGGQEETPPALGEAVRLSVEGRWDFYVEDSAAWSDYVAARLAELGAGDCAPDLTGPGYALRELLAHDDFTARFTAHGLRDGGNAVFAGEVERTLAEEI